VVLAINKMDLVDYQESVFQEIREAFSSLPQVAGLASLVAIPVSALRGDNIVEASANMPWYCGPTLLECLETVEVGRTQSDRPVFPVQWVNRPNADFRGLSGTLAEGQLQTGDAIRVTASGQTARIDRIVTLEGDLPVASAGQAITLVLDHELDVARGDVLSLSDRPLEMTDRFEATLVWMHEEAGLTGRALEIKLGHQWAGASIASLGERLDVLTQKGEPCTELALNDIVTCELSLSRPLVFDRYDQCRALGSFILVDRVTQATVALGMIRSNLRSAGNLHRQSLSITRSHRERLNGHVGQVLWFTGLSGAGKSTIANLLEQRLHAQGYRTYLLDGDNVRQGLNRDLGFSDTDRIENIRRVAEVAGLMMDAGLIVLTAFISPFRAERELARSLIGPDRFSEIHVDTPLEVCEQRDPKGLYRKARAGLLPNLTGIGSPYEVPERPDFIVRSEQALAAQLDALADLIVRV
jgi:bifunctional enzyme CysN/CysC